MRGKLVLRQDVSMNASLAPLEGRRATTHHTRPAVAVGPLRILALPFVLVSAVLTGALFVVLLPICGIASIAEAMTAASWRFMRRALARTPHAKPV
jgi:hypothetical protein